MVGNVLVVRARSAIEPGKKRMPGRARRSLIVTTLERGSQRGRILSQRSGSRDGPPRRLTLRAASSKLLSIRFLYAKRDKEDG